MRSVMKGGIRPRVMRLYAAEDTLFSGYEVQEGECVLVIATAGLAEVAEAESRAVERFAGGARGLGEEPWQRWQRHRFDLSAERLQAFSHRPARTSTRSSWRRPGRCSPSFTPGSSPQ